MRHLLAICLAWLLPALLLMAPAAGATADDFRLSAPQSLIDTGFFKYVLPRFSLKTGVRIKLVGANAEAEVAFALEGRGRAVFSGLGRTWRMRLRARDHAGAARFAEWLTSEIGRRSSDLDGAPLFTPVDALEAAVETAAYAGDAKRGLPLSRAQCGRCHAVSEKTRSNGIGSTPSFFVLRGLSDWEGRFRAFFAINPHPAFTQIEGVTAPFPIDRPSPIVPLEITIDELEHILAYVATLAPADLGKPLEHQ